MMRKKDKHSKTNNENKNKNKNSKNDFELNEKNEVKIEREGMKAEKEKLKAEPAAAEEKRIDAKDDKLADEIIELSANYNEALEKIEKLEMEKADLKDQLLRRAAEFDNFKRRTENDQINLIKYAAESFITKILPVYDDLERSIEHINDENNFSAMKDGLVIILDKFRKTLEEQGIKKIEAKGKPFDFNYHEALMQQVNNDLPPHTVIDEVETGYTYKDKVIRHSKVIVSQEDAGANTEEKNNDSNNEENEE